MAYLFFALSFYEQFFVVLYPSAGRLSRFFDCTHSVQPKNWVRRLNSRLLIISVFHFECPPFTIYSRNFNFRLNWMINAPTNNMCFLPNNLNGCVIAIGGNWRNMFRICFLSFFFFGVASPKLFGAIIHSHNVNVLSKTERFPCFCVRPLKHDHFCR